MRLAYIASTPDWDVYEAGDGSIVAVRPAEGEPRPLWAEPDKERPQ